MEILQGLNRSKDCWHFYPDESKILKHFNSLSVFVYTAGLSFNII